MKYLRTYIRGLIREAVDDVTLSGLGAIVSPYGGSQEAIIFDMGGMKVGLERWRAEKEGWMQHELFGDVIRGRIVVGPTKNPCAGAWEVGLSWGPGLGDVVYGLGHALSPSGILMPDREDVSARARRGWQAQAAKVSRGERSSVPLDDIRAHVSGAEHPNHTDDPRDDCRTHGIDYLDRAYMPKGNEKALLDRLVGQGLRVIGELEPVKFDRLRKVLRVAANVASGRDAE